MADADVVLLARRRQKQLVAVLYAVVLVLTAVMILLLDRPLSEVSLLGWLMLGLPLLLPLVGMSLAFWGRRRGIRWLQPPLAMGVDRARRRSILAAVRAGRGVDGRDHAVAVDLARRLVGQRWLAYFCLPLAAWSAVRALTGERDGTTLIVCAALVGMVAVTPWIFLDARRARRWLARESATDS